MWFQKLLNDKTGTGHTKYTGNETCCTPYDMSFFAVVVCIFTIGANTLELSSLIVGEYMWILQGFCREYGGNVPFGISGESVVSTKDFTYSCSQRIYLGFAQVGAFYFCGIPSSRSSCTAYYGDLFCTAGCQKMAFGRDVVDGVDDDIGFSFSFEEHVRGSFIVEQRYGLNGCLWIDKV